MIICYALLVDSCMCKGCFIWFGCNGEDCNPLSLSLSLLLKSREVEEAVRRGLTEWWGLSSKGTQEHITSSSVNVHSID
jgi:hypothetical protein